MAIMIVMPCSAVIGLPEKKSAKNTDKNASHGRIQSSHGTLSARLQCPVLLRIASGITVRLNRLKKKKMAYSQDGARLASYLRYSLSSIAWLGQGVCLLVRTQESCTDVICSVFATPGTILGLSGSVGLSLYVIWVYAGIVLTTGRIMWVMGGIIAAAGMQVYIVWGTVSFSTP